jgi:PhoPQ-activated pathogenicity-related protein
MLNKLIFIVKVILFLLCLGFAFGGPRNGKFKTPLDDYVHAPDPTYKWTFDSSFQGFGYTVYVLNLTSQTWMTANETNHPVWAHWLAICIPEQITHHTAFMYIDGGGITDSAPKTIGYVEMICLNSRTVTATLLTIPNEPISFTAEGKSRNEDAIIAYTWAHFLNHTDQPIWLLRLPMTKAAVKAMDAIQEFTATLPRVPPVKNFVVAGASKRGWTTWTTGCVDDRVIAMVPMVMPILNIVPNMNHHYQAYGGWSFALDDYLQMGIMDYLNRPEFLELAAVVDPYSYRDRLTMPKLVLTAAGDEFFLPDSPQFFMKDLPDEKFLTVIPDAEHSLGTAIVEVINTISTFYRLILTNTPRPKYHYQIIRSNTTGSIIVNTTGGSRPYQVKMWYAYTMSNTLRDFRLVICPKIPDCLQPILWLSEDLQESGPGTNTWIAQMDAPKSGWAAFLIELTYSYTFGLFEKEFLQISTELNIIPDQMPFPPPPK